MPELVYGLFDVLLWQNDGGSGYNLTRADLMDMAVPEILWFAARKQEHLDAIIRARNKK